MTPPRRSLGSRWLRWDPHLHVPGTLRNDQFRGDWDGWIRRIEAAQPAPIALGISDYFTLRGYTEVLRRRQAGALASVALVFPNVELRLTIETKDRQGINLHLLVCPEEADHVARVEEKLAQLRFPYRDDVFRRPLIIDQPQENLDPRSVYADLVPFFRDAARRRQIIMVMAARRLARREAESSVRLWRGTG